MIRWVTAAMVAALCLSACTAAPARTVARTGPQPAGCGWNDSLTRNSAADVMAGRIAVAGQRPVEIGPSADIDWTRDPYRNKTWMLFFTSAKWAESLVTDFRATGDTAKLDRAVAIARDVVRDNPDPGHNTGSWNDHSTVLRTSFLVCLWENAPAQRDWLQPAIEAHAVALADRYSGSFNHGTMQNMGLMAAGCALGRRGWMDRAAGRLREEASHALDAEGVLDEQATGYSGFFWRLWSDVLAESAHCGVAAPPGLAAKVAAIDRFLAHSIAPDGNLVPIGDTFASPTPYIVGPQSEFATTRGARGTAPTDTFATFARGYAFGRTSWTAPGGHQWSVRYGPGRTGHGHNDHLGVTYFSRGRHLLVDSSFDGYDDKPYRFWSTRPEAHNVPVLPGTAFDATAATTLRRVSTGPGVRTLGLTDHAYAGTTRDRTVLVDDTLQAMLVRDDITTDRVRDIRMLWHLDPSWRPDGVRGTGALSSATFLSPDRTLRAWIVQAAEPGTPLPVGASRLVRGQKAPYQGWVGTDLGKRVPNWVVEARRYARTVHAVTAVVVAPAGQDVTFTRVRTSPGTERLTLTVGGTRRTYTTSNSGSLALG